MATDNDGCMALSPEQLNDLDAWILDFLTEHEWATPNLLKVMHGEEHDMKSRQWVSDRVRRLEEHDHLETVHPDAHERQLVDDPRKE